MKRVKRELEYNMFDWWKKVFIDNYANFEGRARRSEYWFYVLTNFIFSFTLPIIAIFLAFIIGPFALGIYILGLLYGIANIIPNLAVIVRRLHDTGKSGWTFFFILIPIAGPIILIVFLATEGDRGQNQYGPDPKNPNINEINKIGRTSY